MKLRLYPDFLLWFLVLLGVLSLLDEAWQGPEPPALVVFIQAHKLWYVWEQLRWNYMYSHEVLHFLSGLCGSMLGCWMYFAYQKRKASSAPITKDERPS